MQAAPTLKISKYTVDVDVRNILGEEQRIQVYLSDEMDAQGRSERLQDVLSARNFIPVRREEKTEMIAVQHLSWVRVELIVAIDELDLAAEAEDDSVHASVRVDLDDGSSLYGAFRYRQPAERRRLVDYLTRLPRWVPLRTAEWLYLIGRDRIVRVVPDNGA